MIEIAIIDLLEKIGDDQAEEKEILVNIRKYLKKHREKNALQTREIILFNVQEEA